MLKDDLGTRMKEFYEAVPKTKLVRRMPVAIRIDGKAFHTFTKNFVKPFDDVLIKTMQQTMHKLCENIQGCVFGYTQSDEITLILIDYKKLNSAAFFDYEVQKLCSIISSMATLYFNKFFNENVEDYYQSFVYNQFRAATEEEKLYEIYQKAVNTGAMFDTRCFNIPKEEVANLIYWRQLDAKRNSIQMLGQANFSHKELQHKSCSIIKDMLKTEKIIDWEELPTYKKWGTACHKLNDSIGFEIDENMPMIKDDRNFVEQYIFVKEEDTEN